MTQNPGDRRRRWLVAVLLALWLGEGLFACSSALGPAGEALGWAWVIGLALVAAASRTRTRTPEALLAWLWLLAVLAVASLRALWIELDAPPLLADVERTQLAELLRSLPLRQRFVFESAFRTLEVLVTWLLIGLGCGLAAMFELVVVAVSLAVGRALRDDGPPARVGLLARLGVWLTQLPTLAVLATLGAALLTAALASVVTPAELIAPAAIDLATSTPATIDPTALGPEVADLRHLALPIAGVGAALWLLTGVLLRRLLALHRGGLAGRVVLAIFAAAPIAATVVFLAPGVGTLVGLALWLVLQWTALAFARPRPA